MSKLTFLIWIMAAPTLMGSLVTVTLVVQPFMDDQAFWIPAAAAAGAVIAIPVSFFVARAMKKTGIAK